MNCLISHQIALNGKEIMLQISFTTVIQKTGSFTFCEKTHSCFFKNNVYFQYLILLSSLILLKKVSCIS